MQLQTCDTNSSVGSFAVETLAPSGGREDWVIPDFQQNTEAGNLPDSSAFRKEYRPTIRRSPVLELPMPHRAGPARIKLPDYRIKLLQQWECIVLEIKDNCVACEMHDLTDESKPEEYAEVFLSEFNVFDRPMLEEGAVFYWSVGLETKNTGNVRRYSELRVRRMPPLSRSRLREIKGRADNLGNIFGNGEQYSANLSPT